MDKKTGYGRIITSPYEPTEEEILLVATKEDLGYISAMNHAEMLIEDLVPRKTTKYDESFLNLEDDDEL